jgi:hypothetical protein
MRHRHALGAQKVWPVHELRKSRTDANPGFGSAQLVGARRSGWLHQRDSVGCIVPQSCV